jgi:hypothetical protein
VVFFRFEIAEAGKKIENVIEIVDPVRQSHVVLKERKSFIFKLLRKGDALGGDVQPCDVKAFFRQVTGVTPLAAGEVEHCSTRDYFQVIEQAVNEATGFRFVPVFIQKVVVRRIEPVLKPLGGRFFHLIFHSLFVSPAKINVLPICPGISIFATPFQNKQTLVRSEK